jgi:hypothetical protein
VRSAIWRVFAAAVLAAILEPGVAAAEVPAAPPAQAAPGAAASTDPHLAKALEFLDISGTQAAFEQRFDQMLPMLVRWVHQSTKSDDQKLWDDVEAVARDELHKSVGELVNSEAAIYAAHFSDADLDALIAFYKSDVGRKYLAERPALLKDSTALMMTWSQKVETEVTRRVMDKVARDQKQGHTP